MSGRPIEPLKEGDAVEKARRFVAALQAEDDALAMSLTAEPGGLSAGATLVPTTLVPHAVVGVDRLSPIFAAVAMGRKNLVCRMLRRDPALAKSEVDLVAACGCEVMVGLQGQAIDAVDPSIIGVLAQEGVSMQGNVYRQILYPTGTVRSQSVLQSALSLCRLRVVQYLADNRLMDGWLVEQRLGDVSAVLSLAKHGDNAIAVFEILEAQGWSLEILRAMHNRCVNRGIDGYGGGWDFDEHLFNCAADSGSRRLCVYFVNSLGIRLLSHAAVSRYFDVTQPGPSMHMLRDNRAAGG